jgi:hypothetical protein
VRQRLLEFIRVLNGYLDGVIDSYERTACGDSKEDLPMAELLCDGSQADWQAQETVFDEPIREEIGEVEDGSSIHSAPRGSACSVSAVITRSSLRSSSPSSTMHRWWA